MAEEAGAAAVGAFYADTLRRALDAVAPSLPPSAAILQLQRALRAAAPHHHAELSEALVEALLES